MKHFTKLFFAALIAIPVAINAQVNVSTTTSKRVAVLEEFTGNNCTYCPDGHKRADQIEATYGNSVVTLKIQSGSFAGTDPIFGGNLKTTHGNYIATQFPVGGWPSGAVNRYYLDDSRANWSSHVGTITGQNSPVNMYIDATVDATTKEMTVNVEYYYTTNEANSTNYLHIGYYQDNIPAYQYDPGFYPENFYLLEDQVYKFNHCYRANLTPLPSSGTWGEVISSTTTGSTAIVSKTITLPSTFSTFAVEAGAIKVFAFISKTDKGEIITATKGTPIVSNFPTSNDAKLVYMSAGNDKNCIGAPGSSSPRVIVSNVGGTNLSSFVANYGVNGGNDNYNWSGTLKNTEKVGMSLTATTFTYASSNTLNLEVTTPNGVADDNTADNTKSSNFSGSSTKANVDVVRIEAMVDDWANEESSWIMRSSDGTIIDQVELGDMVDNTTNIKTVSLPAGVDCYQFEILDTYGDGWGSSKTFKVFNNATNSQIFSVNVSTGTMKKRLTEAAEFTTTAVSTIDHSNNTALKLYPNPTNGNSNLELNLVQNSNVNVDVLNTLGQLVFTKTLTNVSGNQTVNIDSQNFESGLYLVNIKVGDSVTTKKLTVTK